MVDMLTVWDNEVGLLAMVKTRQYLVTLSVFVARGWWALYSVTVLFCGQRPSLAAVPIFDEIESVAMIFHTASSRMKDYPFFFFG